MHLAGKSAHASLWGFVQEQPDASQNVHGFYLRFDPDPESVGLLATIFE